MKMYILLGFLVVCILLHFVAEILHRRSKRLLQLESEIHDANNVIENKNVIKESGECMISTLSHKKHYVKYIWIRSFSCLVFSCTLGKCKELEGATHKSSEALLGPQNSTIDSFATTDNAWKPLTIVANLFILDTSRCPG